MNRYKVLVTQTVSAYAWITVAAENADAAKAKALDEAPENNFTVEWDCSEGNYKVEEVDEVMAKP